MKLQSVAYYNAYGGVYKRPQLAAKYYGRWFAGLVFVLMILASAAVATGVKLPFGHAKPLVTKTNSRLVASTINTPFSQPETVPQKTESPKAAHHLTSALESALAAAEPVNPITSWSVSLYDVQTKQWLLKSNSQQQMTSASLYKLYAVYGLANKLPFEQWAGVQVVGQSLQDCVDKMLRLSDNICGDAVGSFVGWKAIDKYVHAAGFMGTNLNSKAGPQTTADDTTRFMTSLYQGKLLDAAATNFVLKSLQNQQYRQAIPAGCEGCTTYNKTGNEPGLAHDTAVVISGDHTYVVTIMSTGQGTYAQIAAIERALQKVLQ